MIYQINPRVISRPPPDFSYNFEFSNRSFHLQIYPRMNTSHFRVSKRTEIILNEHTRALTPLKNILNFLPNKGGLMKKHRSVLFNGAQF